MGKAWSCGKGLGPLNHPLCKLTRPACDTLADFNGDGKPDPSLCMNYKIKWVPVSGDDRPWPWL